MATYLLDATSYSRPFGVGRYAYSLALALHRLKGELDADEQVLAAVRLTGDGAVTSDLQLDDNTDPVVEPYASYHRRRAVHFARTARGTNADLVHFVEGPQVISGVGIPWVVTCHDLIPLLMAHHYIGGLYSEMRQRLRDYLTYAGARRIIAISQTTARLLVDFMGLQRERISVVLQGVDHERFHTRQTPGERDAIAKRYGLPKRYTMYVGAIDWRKRVEMLIENYDNVFRATGVPLALVGAEFDTPHSQIKHLMEKARSGSIVRVGRVRAADLPALYRHAELHVLPSVYEGFGLTVLEAMASGCPVVTTRGGALHEVAGNAARYIPPDSPSGLEDALAELLSNPVERDRLRARGLEQAKRFTWERTARQTLEVYRHALGRYGSRRTEGGAQMLKLQGSGSR
jgi:glycosyltransferase involved in cell wall biosynthesis